MAVQPIHKNMRRRLVKADKTQGSYLDNNNSALLAGTSWKDSQQAASGTAGLTIKGTFTDPKVGQYVQNTSKNFMAQIKSASGSKITVRPPMGTAGTNWGQTTGNGSSKLIDSEASFSGAVQAGMIAAKRDLSDYAVVTGVDSDTKLSLSKNLFGKNDDYTLMQGFEKNDNIRLGTAVLNGDAGHVMVEVPRFYYNYEWTGTHNWYVRSLKSDNTPNVFPAFKKPGGGTYDFLYIAAFEGAVDDYGFANGKQLIDYSLGSAKLGSFAGMHPVCRGQRSEFRHAAGNNGDGWHIIDWYENWAWQLLLMLEYESLDSQAALGKGLTTWSRAGRDDWVVKTLNRPVNHTGYSINEGNQSVNRQTGAANASGVLSYRGIENPWGNIWKWLDGVNYNDGRVYLANDPAGYADDISNNPYVDAGVSQPQNNGYISDIHHTPNGLIVAESAGGSSTHLPDYYWYNGGWRVARAGGVVAIGARAGFACLSASYSSVTRNTATGSRVALRI